jgi:ribose 5-phosphate isomerase B
MKVIIGSDHAGFKVKEKLKKFLAARKILCEDVGTYSEESVDYPDYAAKVARKVARNKNRRGILVCGAGIGMVIAANKVRGIRAVAAYDAYSAKMSRLHNDTNVLGLRGRNFSYEKTKRIVGVWLETPFSGEKRHKRRIAKISSMEKE